MAAPLASEQVLKRRRVLAAVCVLSCTALVALVATSLDGSLGASSQLPASLFGGGGASLHEGGLTADASGLRSLDSEVSSAVGENSKLAGEYSSTFDKAPCTSLRAGGCSAKVVDNYLKNIDKATAGDPDAGCCGEENEGAAAGGAAPAAGDMSIGAVVKALENKFRKMKQQFREVRADYYKGAPRDLTIKVSPRGPRGFTGPPGVNGDQGVLGEKGAIGPVGPRGWRGWHGDQGPQGRKGKKGMTGSIGEAGDMGAKGFQGATGSVGFAGPPGSKGLPGAAGVMGSNGKDGPPGPPGQNGVPGPPGFAGDGGNAGANGAPGKSGLVGPVGSKGRSGTTGGIGPAGPDGAAGKDGVGPAKAGPVKKAGTGTWGPQFLKTRACTKLGIANNLGGDCKPLCENCDSLSGFMLVNEDGLRYKDMGFDDHHFEAGSIQAQNICMLARYGNKGKMSVTPDTSSYMALVDKKGVKDQVHWFGDCKAGSKKEKRCCTNSRVMTASYNFGTFATGGQCGGDTDTGKPTKVLFCVFDKSAFIRQSRPSGPPVYPPEKLVGLMSLKSNGKVSKRNMLAHNGLYSCSMLRNGNFVVYSQGGTVLWETKTASQGTGPYRLTLQSDGNLVLLDKTDKALWSSGTSGKGGVKLIMQGDGNLVLFSSTMSIIWSSNTHQSTDVSANLNLGFSKALCVGTACMTGALFSRMKTVSDGVIDSATGYVNLDCAGGPQEATVTHTFLRKFAKPPKVYLNLVGAHNCQNGHASWRARIYPVETTDSYIKFKIGSWADTKAYKMEWSFMAIGQELIANVENYKSRGKKAGDESRGIMCVGKYCAGEQMIQRLIYMSNAHLQADRYYQTVSGGCGTGGYDERRINFPRPYASRDTPTVLVSIYQYDFCWGHINNRAYAWVKGVDSTGFNVVAQTWGDTKLYGIGVEWMAISKELMVRPQQYFPLVPAPTDPVASQMCFGNTCIRDADKWLDVMNMANWRVESAKASYYWHCHHRTGTVQITFAQAFEEVPEVKLFVNKFDECGFKSFEWKTDIQKVTTVGFEVKAYGYAMYSIDFSWVAWSKDMAPPALPPPPVPKKQTTHKSSGTWGTCFDGGKGSLCDQLGVKDNMCGECIKLCDKCTGKEGFILENSRGLRWGPDELGFDDNQLTAGNYNGQNYCMLAKYGNKGKFTSKDFPSSRSFLKTASGASSQKHFYGNCNKGSTSEASCCTNARLLESGWDWSKFSRGNTCSGDGDLDRPSKTLICYFDYDSYQKMK